MNTKTNINKRNPNPKYLATAGWNLCKSLLWQNQEFNDTEVELAVALIQQYIQQSPNAMLKFIAFCERVQLAFEYINRNPSRFVPHPLKWLSPYFEHGFYGTKDWYMDLVHERKFIPVHRFELRVLAEAYLQYILQPTKEIYTKGKNALMHYTQGQILQAYNNIILNFNYNV